MWSGECKFKLQCDSTTCLPEWQKFKRLTMSRGGEEME